MAIAFRDGPVAGLDALAAVEATGALDGYALLPVVRADLLRRASRPAHALEAYRIALEHMPAGPERRLVERRIRELTDG